MACGDCHTAAVTSDGRLYTFGDGGFGQLGHGDTRGKLQPTEVKGLLAGFKRVACVSCAACHTAVATDDGCVFTFGVGRLGQLGLGDIKGRLSPCLVGGVLQDKHVSMVSAGNCHTAAVTSEGLLFVWGDGEFGQLGLGTTRRHLTPEQVEGGDLVDDKVASVSCGHYHTACATMQGNVLTWGDGQQGQLGLGDCTGRYKPCRLLGALLDKRVCAVAAGDCHTVCVTAPDDSGPGRIFSWGGGSFAQTGLGHKMDVNVPNEVGGLPPASQVCAVSCGAIHTCVETEDRRIFTWGNTWGDSSEACARAEVTLHPSEVQSVCKGRKCTTSRDSALSSLPWPLW